MADVNELKATFEQVIAAINRQGAAAWVSFIPKSTDKKTKNAISSNNERP